MSHILYGQSIDDATVTYSGTEDTNYPIARIQDRDKNSFFRDSAPGAASVEIEIDFGEARSCDYLIIGNYIAEADTSATMKLERSSNGSSWTATINPVVIESSSLIDYIQHFNSASFRYWKITIADSGTTSVDNLQIGDIFLGSRITLDHSPDVGNTVSHQIKAQVKEAVGGNRSGVKLRADKRQTWEFNLSYFDDDNSNLTDLETLVEDVGINAGLSALPFYFSDDSGSTITLVRTNGPHKLTEIGDGVWNFTLTLEEEL